jgi:S-adenosylmethionine decarboxylase
MNTTALTTIAPEIFRKRLLIEGFFEREVDADVLVAYFKRITADLGLRTYGDPIVHETGGKGKAENEGYDAFVPLIDSGIYIAVWSQRKFLSTIIYTCAEFDEARGVESVRDFFHLTEHEAAVF